MLFTRCRMCYVSCSWGWSAGLINCFGITLSTSVEKVLDLKSRAWEPYSHTLFWKAHTLVLFVTHNLEKLVVFYCDMLIQWHDEVLLGPLPCNYRVRSDYRVVNYNLTLATGRQPLASRSPILLSLRKAMKRHLTHFYPSGVKTNLICHMARNLSSLC